ncbi:ATP-dependent endonuclease [Escherichia coli]|uniref:ATP-dependent nuclease n=1 Tax=Escherichia coli TaxID=562 RepID=UPI000BE445BE|nr:ATP-binding protein [Escherichia coli]HAW2816704.1 AAA family ATPase [Escherichia coli]
MASYKEAALTVSNVASIKKMDFKFTLKPGLMCLVGANGSGKTTLLNLLSRFLNYPLNNYFYGDVPSDAEVSYSYDGTKILWKRDGGRWVRDNPTDDNVKSLIRKGTYESGVVYGNRFVVSSKENIREFSRFYQSIKEDDLIPVSDFIVKSLGKILRNDGSYYNGLKTITKAKRDNLLSEKNALQSKTVKEDLKNNYLLRKETPYLIKRGTSYITQYQMSSGEFMLLRLLGFIDARMQAKESETRLVLIDEVEIALHPAAQKRLFYFFKDISVSKNVFVIFSTHSQAIINMCRPQDIHLVKNTDGQTHIQTPCFPNYAIRSTYELNGYDFCIVVEDELARRVVWDVIEKEKLCSNKMINVVIGGGWSQIIPFVNDMISSKVLPSSRIIVVLDKDVKERFEQKYMSPCKTCDIFRGSGVAKPKLPNNISFHDDILFLPVDSLEKELFSKLIKNVDYDFINALDNNVYFKTKALDDCLSEFKDEASRTTGFESMDKYDRDGKKLWAFLVKNLNPHYSKDDFISSICRILMDMAKTTELWAEFSKDLTNQLSFLRQG